MKRIILLASICIASSVNAQNREIKAKLSPQTRKYLLEIASQVDRENAVFLFNSSGDPTLMREGNDLSAVYEYFIGSQ